jgi:hypothetical protein
MKIPVFLDVTLRLLARSFWSFKESYSFHLQGSEIQEQHLLLNIEAWLSSEMSEATSPKMSRHIPDEQNLQLNVVRT